MLLSQMFTEIRSRSFLSLMLSVLFHMLVLLLLYPLFSPRRVEDVGDLVTVQLLRESERRLPRYPLLKPPIRPITKGKPLGIHPPFPSAVSSVETHLQVEIDWRETGVTPPSEGGLNLWKAEGLNFAPIGFRPYINFPPPRSRELPFSSPRPNLDLKLPGLESVLTSEPSELELEVEDLREFLSIIRRRIEKAKRYPDEARRKGIEGTVVLAFTVGRRGELESVEVISSSGYKWLDEAAIQTINRAAPFPPLERFSSRESLRIEVAITFKLESRWR